MKLSRFVCSACLLSSLLALAGCARPDPAEKDAGQQATASSDNLRFQALNVGRALDQANTVTPTTLFLPGDKIIASVLTKDAGHEAAVEVRLIALSDGRIVSKLGRAISPEGDTSTNFEFKKTGPWPLGRYVVEARLAGKLQASQPIEVQVQLPPGAAPKQ